MKKNIIKKNNTDNNTGNNTGNNKKNLYNDKEDLLNKYLECMNINNFEVKKCDYIIDLSKNK